MLRKSNKNGKIKKKIGLGHHQREALVGPKGPLSLFVDLSIFVLISLTSCVILLIVQEMLMIYPRFWRHERFENNETETWQNKTKKC